MRAIRYDRATDYCCKVTDGTHDTPKQTESGKLLVTSKHIKGNEIDYASAYRISEDDYNKIKLQLGLALSHKN